MEGIKNILKQLNDRVNKLESSTASNTVPSQSIEKLPSSKNVEEGKNASSKKDIIFPDNDNSSDKV